MVQSLSTNSLCAWWERVAGHPHIGFGDSDTWAVPDSPVRRSRRGDGSTFCQPVPRARQTLAPRDVARQVPVHRVGARPSLRAVTRTLTTTRLPHSGLMLTLFPAARFRTAARQYFSR